MNEERPIIFTILMFERKGQCQIKTNDPRGENCHYLQKTRPGGHTHRLYLADDMLAITEELNNKGYAVLFEVD